MWRGKAEHCLAREAEQRRLRFGVSSVVVRDFECMSATSCMLSITKHGMKWVRGARTGVAAGGRRHWAWRGLGPVDEIQDWEADDLAVRCISKGPEIFHQQGNVWMVVCACQPDETTDLKTAEKRSPFTLDVSFCSSVWRLTTHLLSVFSCLARSLQAAQCKPWHRGLPLTTGLFVGL